MRSAPTRGALAGCYSFMRGAWQEALTGTVVLLDFAGCGWAIAQPARGMIIVGAPDQEHRQALHPSAHLGNQIDRSTQTCRFGVGPCPDSVLANEMEIRRPVQIRPVL